jgi:hypothetical protein
MEAKIEAPKPRTFGALLFMFGAALSKSVIHSSENSFSLKLALD